MFSDLVLQVLDPSWDVAPHRHQLAEFSGRGIHLDIKETPNQYEISADLPGVTKEQAKLEVKDHVLTISYERKFEQKNENETYHRMERFQGTAARSIRLPRNCDEEKVEAKFNNGVLNVTIPKIPEPQAKNITVNEQYVSFTVALKLRNVVRLKKQFLAVSDPKSSVYGIYQTLEQVNDQFGASPEDRLKVISYLKRIPFSLVDASAHNFVNVKASLLNVERFFDTKLSLVKHVSHLSSPGVIRADELIVFPPDIAPLVAFTSLNSPVHMKPLRANELEPQISDSVTASQSVYNVSASGGNNDVIIGFKAVCSDGELNNMNPPCSNTSGVPLPTFSSSVMSYSVAGEPTLNQPLQFDISYGSVYCAYPKNLLPCNGNQTLGGAGCTCYAKYRLVFNGLGQFYSNSDLAAFLSLSGLPTASIPESQARNITHHTFLSLSLIGTEQVFGDLPDDQSNPRGEAQLDVEYIMVRPPMSISGHRGFLAYLTYVTNQTNPSLVQSLSYGDVEAPWQVSVVEKYLALNQSLPPPGYFNSTGRAYPDVSTACGVGSSIETVNCCQYSFAAAPGWDAVTGLGSPNFEILTNLIVVPAAASTVIVKNTTLVEYTTIVNNSAVVDNSNNSYIKPIALAAVVMSALSLIVLLAAGLVFIVYWKTIFGKDEIHESSENLLHTRGA
ncbi:unnamed protein product [Sphagnum balticum]